MANRIVTKALAGIEDLLLGTGSVVQTRNGVSKTIKKIDAAGLIYENAETIRTRFGNTVQVKENYLGVYNIDTDTAEETYVYMLGFSTAGDGGGGLLWLDTTDTTTTPDDTIVFSPDNPANGRWKRVDTSDYTSPDRGDADYTIKSFDFGTQKYATALTANRTVTLPTVSLYTGKRISVIRTAGGPFNLLVGSYATLTGVGIVTLQYLGLGSWEVLEEPDSTSEESFNGSFETDNNNDGIPDNWTLSTLALGTIAIDNTVSAHGLGSLKFTSGNNGGGTATSKRIDVVMGTELTVNFLYKSSAVASLNKVEVNTYNLAGSALSTFTLYTEGASNPSTFTHIEKTVVLDATAVTAEIVLTGVDAASTTKSAGTTTHFDNIEYHVFAKRQRKVILDPVTAAGASIDISDVPLWANNIYLDVHDVVFVNTASLNLTAGLSGTPITTSYTGTNLTIYQSGSVVTNITSGTAGLQIGLVGGATSYLSGRVHFSRIPGTTNWTFVSSLGVVCTSPLSDQRTTFVHGRMNFASELDFLRLTANTNNFTSGTFTATCTD